MNKRLIAILQKEGLEHLAGVLTEQAVTDSILSELSDNDLREMGIDKLGERKRLLAAFAATGAAQNEPGAMVEIQGGALPDGRKVGDFAIGKFAVTMEEWRVVREWGVANGFEMAIGRSGGLTHPVTEVSWYDAVKWCNAKSQMEGLKVAYTIAGSPYRKGDSNEVSCDWKSGGYRLPTEAEWEWAARGGVKSCGSTYAGGDDLGAVGWFDQNSGGMAHPVGQKAPNELGLFDMSGNVWEWCWELWSTEGVHRVIRGGSWHNVAASCCSSSRGNGSPDTRDYSFGFRLARVPSQ
jgi:sulfatase modifying factor 1